jgi:hypothetical protein
MEIILLYEAIYKGPWKSSTYNTSGLCGILSNGNKMLILENPKVYVIKKYIF